MRRTRRVWTVGASLLVGAASRSVLPTVDGSTGYLRTGLPPASDPYSMGVFVPRFDQGRVAVGNGDDRAFWVHDDIRVNHTWYEQMVDQTVDAVMEAIQRRFVVGLGNDELGYVKSLTDFRIACMADQLTGQPGTCGALQGAGVIEFSDGAAGATCKWLADDPAAVGELVARVGQQAAQAVIASCRYGQTIGEARGHYPETNSAGWDLADDMLAAVGRLTGDFSAEQVNPDFPGYNDEFPPPVGA